MKVIRSVSVSLILLLASLGATSSSSANTYMGPGELLINAIIVGLESQLVVNCVAEGSDRLTMYFPGAPWGLEKRVYCYDGFSRQLIVVKVKGSEQGNSQHMSSVEIGYAEGAHCADCTTSY